MKRRSPGSAARRNTVRGFIPAGVLAAVALVGCTGSTGGGAANDGGPPRRDASGGEDAAALVDGRVPDAATTDGQVPDATVSPSCEDAWLCDDFESYGTGTTPNGRWSALTTGGTVTVDGTKSVSGTKSVHFHVDHSASFRRAMLQIGTQGTAISATNVVWGRMQMYLTAAPTYNNGAAVHWTNIQGDGTVDGMGFRAFYRYGGMHERKMMANYETNGVSTDCAINPDYNIPVGEWACVEWRYNGPNNEMNFYVNGAAVPELTVVEMSDYCGGNDTDHHWYAPTFDIFKFGWEQYQQATNDIDYWIDDVALDDARIGCP